MIDDGATARRWLVAVAAVLVAFALQALMYPAAGAASHLPFIVAIATIAAVSGRGPAMLPLAAGLTLAIWRMVDGSTSLPDSLSIRTSVFLGYSLLGALLIYVGQSARRLAQESKRARAELDLALAAAEVGSWNFDFGTRALRYSSNVGPMLGQPAGFVHSSLEEWQRNIHPGDAAALKQSLREARRGESYEVRYRLRTPAGDWRWLLVRGKITRDAQGRRRHADGIVMDITGVRKAELDRWRSSEELRTLLDLIPAGVAVAQDASANQITVSSRFARILGIGEDANASLSGDQREQLPYRCMRDGLEIAGDDLPMQVAARTGREVHDFEFDLVFGDERVLHLLSSAAPLFDADGKVRGAIGVHTDVTPLKQAQRELERMDRQKDVFLATLAHELRNPLAPMRYAAMVLRTRTDASVVEESARIIERQTAQMGQLLDELLDMSRVTRDVIELRREPVDMSRLVRHEVEALRMQLTELSREIDVNIVASAWVVGDETRLHQIVGNLLNNAVKYTQPGGRIEVTLSSGDDELELRVRDNGIGIASADLPQVFDLFTQIRRPDTHPGNGLGIGLAVVRRLVQLHGGRISVASAGPDAGTEFVLCFPRAAAPARPGRPPEAAIEPPSQQTRVLVCDDNVDATDSLAQLLELYGFVVRITYDGSSAKQAVDEFRPDVAVLDLGLPDISGEDVARWIRGKPWGDRVLLIAVTGWGQQQDRDRTAAAGFHHHLVKPVNPQELLKLLGRKVGAARPSEVAS